MILNYQEFKNYLKELDHKPKLLVHACCGPCSTHTLKVLKDFFEIAVYYANDNMDTIEEYDKRYNELEKVCKNYDIKLIKKEYEPKYYFEAVKGYEHLGEFSQRCEKCMELRLTQTAEFAKLEGFDMFTTSLSISPYKSSKLINELGYKIAANLGVDFLFSDFKKENGYQDSIIISKELCLYRQEYCGCIFSKKEMELKKEEK